MKPSLVLCACSVAVLALSGCVGGGHDHHFSDNVPIDFQTAGTTVAYPASSASETTTTAGGVTGSRIDASGAGSTVTLTTNAFGNLSGVTFSINTPGTTFTQAYSSGFSEGGTLALGDLASFLESVATSSGSNGFVVSQIAQSNDLTSSAYGLWASNDTAGAGRIGVFGIGNLTPTLSVPSTGTATYNGTTIGTAATGTNQMALTGNIQLIANFATGSVATTISGLQTENIATRVTGTLTNLTGSQTITGNAYTGALSGGGLAGTLNGNFYGSAAQETNGVWSVSGGGTSAMGAYGAR